MSDEKPSVNSNKPQEIFLNQQEKHYLLNKKSITMCADPNWMPFEEIQEGQHRGISADFMHLIQKWLGIPIRLIVTETWQQSLIYAKKRKCDIMSAVMSTPDRSVFLNFTQPYMETPLVIVTAIDELFVSDIEEIVDKPIGVVQGYAFTELLRLKYPTIMLYEVSSITEGLQKVEAGKLYGFMDTLASVSYAFQTKNHRTLKISGKFNELWYLGIGVRKDDALLLTILKKAVTSISGRDRKKILQHWKAVKYKEKFDYNLFWQLFAGIVVVILLILYRYSILLKYNKHLNVTQEKVKLQNRLLSKLAITDKLTQLYNRSKLDEMLSYYQNLSNRYHENFSVILMDIDDFKLVNDKFGHPVGDQVLTALAKILKANIRVNDIFGRWGGEEFMVICPVTDLQGIQTFAEQLRVRVAELQIIKVGHITISLGASEFQPGETIESLISRTDKALYRAKAEGKNCVRIIKD